MMYFLGCVCRVGMSGVFDCACDANLTNCFEFVGVAYNVANEGVVWRQELVVVQWLAGTDCFVFRAVGYILDDLFDFGVVADVLVSKLVESLFECTVLVVFVVGYVVQPSCGYCVQNEVVVLSAVFVVLIDDE